MRRYVKEVSKATSKAPNTNDIRWHYAITLVSMMGNVCSMLEHSSTHMIRSTMPIRALVQGFRAHAAICLGSVHGNFQSFQYERHTLALSNHISIMDRRCSLPASALIYAYDTFDDANSSISTRFQGTCGDMSRKCPWQLPKLTIRTAYVGTKQSHWYQWWAMFVPC